MITLGSNKYIESQNIRVFPCAYRGYYNSSATPATTLVFDPEARATTEANFTNTFHKVSSNKESYVVAWVPDAAPGKEDFGTLKCVIGGYYFEIYNQQMSDFFYPDSGDPYYLCIKTEPVSLGTSEPDKTTARTTEVLGSFADTTTYLDVKKAEDEYAFTGLLISTTAVGTASLVPFKQGTDFFKLNSEPTDKIGKYYGTTDTDTLTIITSDNVDDIPAGAQFYAKSETYTINSAALPVTNLLDVGSGKYSLRMIKDITEQGTNTTVASGDYSVALGLSTAATGEASTALGNNTEASAKGAFAAGNNTKASGEGAAALGNNTEASGTNAVSLGSNTKAEADNQVVIGTYNEKDTDQAFIIANGESDSNRSNKFTVSYEGNIKTLGNIEVNGNTTIEIDGETTSFPAISSTGTGDNDLVLGTPNINSCGSISVYGTGNAKVFEVTRSGATNIAGITEIKKDTQSNGIASGALRVKGGVGITKKLNVGEDTTIYSETNYSKTTDDTTTPATITHSAALKVTGGVWIGKAAAIGGAVTVGDTLTVVDDTMLSSDLTVAGLATFEDTLTVTNLASFSNDVAITGKATSSQTLSEDEATTLTTKSYVDEKHTDAKNYTDESIDELDYSDPEEATTSTGKYVQHVVQENGKIAVKVRGFEASVNKDVDSNAPTSKAISTFVNTSINTSLSNLWTSAHVTDPSDSTKKATLKDIILNAAYPIGSIYTYYSQETVTECPIAKSLGGTWEAIEGRFLCAANSTRGSLYYRDMMGGHEETQLVAHYHELERNSDNLTTTKVASESSGEHSHTTTITARAHDASTDTGLRSGNPNGGCHQWDFSYPTDTQGAHTHTINLTDIKTASAGVNIEDTPGTNLPPYLAVYMWKRTA